LDETLTLVEHAKRELELCGQAAEDPAYAASLVAAVAAFASYGHSGGSHYCAVEQLLTLLRFETLSPLTDDPEEWMQVAESDSRPPAGMWQSRRDPGAFSLDGGRTYYHLAHGPSRDNPQPTQPGRGSAVASQRPPQSRESLEGRSS
jgi:hypothetical protein